MQHFLKKTGAFLMVVLIGLLATVAEIQAQQSTSSKDTVALSEDIAIDELKTRRQLVEKMTDIDAAIKADSLKDIDQAIADLTLAKGANKTTRERSQLIQTAPERIKSLRAELKKPLSTPGEVEKQAQQMDTLKLEQRRHQVDAELAKAQSKLREWNERLTEEKNSVKRTPQQLATASSRLNEIQAELAKRTDVTETDIRNYAKVLSLKSEREKLTAESKLNELRQRSHNLVAELLSLERDVAQKAVGSRTKILNIWQTEVQKRRRQDAVQSRKEAQEAMIEAPELPKILQDQFDINIELSTEMEEITQEEAILTGNYKEHQSRLEALETDFETAKKRVETTALTGAIGLALRTQRLNLPTADLFSEDSKARQSRMSEISEKQIALDQMLRKLSAPKAMLNRLMGSVGDLSDVDRQSLDLKIQQLIANRIDIVERLKSGYNRIFKLMQDIEFSAQKIASTAKNFGELLDRHLLWIRSSKRLNTSDLPRLTFAFGWFFEPASWRQLSRDVSLSLQKDGIFWVLGIIMVLILAVARQRERQKIRDINARVQQQPLQDSISLTFKALGFTVLLAIVWPFILAFPAIVILNLRQVQPFTRAMASGLLAVAQALLWLNLLYYICRKNGLAQVHFRWSEPVRRVLRSNLSWIMPIVLTCNFFLAAMESVPDTESSDPLAKFALIGLAAAIALFSARVLHFKGGMTSVLIQKYPKSWLVRLRYVWYPLVVAVPLLVIYLAVQGYYYSAIEIRNLIRLEVVLIIGLIVLNDLVLRFLMLTRRKLTLKKARLAQQQQKQKISDLDSGAAPPATGEDPSSIMESTMGMGTIDDQTRTLLKTVIYILGFVGLWAIWEPVFPAFGFLQNIKLWSYTTVVDGATQLNTITLANIAIAAIVIAITVIAVRNLPGLLEMILLNRLPMDPGARYAYVAICRYTLTAVGIVIALNTVGIRWSSLQWLVAALGVGIGFGLQEIVANFICGLIILFERPIRVGDVVTIGTTDGVVTKIRIRATTIRNWDRKELLVPNKEFITGRLLNWSLSDQTTRIVITVGVAYGSNVDKALALMQEAAEEHEHVLDDPQPLTSFEGFGDNSLTLLLRAYLGSIDVRVPTTTELHRAINQKFAEAGIVISFPQRDVHLDATGPLNVRVVSEPTGTDEAKPSAVAPKDPDA